MTDRGSSALRQTRTHLTIGPSDLRWENGALLITINERATPHGTKIAGTVCIDPQAITDQELPLAPDGSHVWRPFAPTSRISVDLYHKGWAWQGHGYFDANFGTRALEQDFNYWTWARLPIDGGTACFYDLERRDGSTAEAGCFVAPDGGVEMIALPDLQKMRRSLWGLRRVARCDAGHHPRQDRHMLDAPFYCRSGLETTINGQRVSGVHEALNLRVFDSWWLRPMLAVRVPRRRNWRFSKL